MHFDTWGHFPSQEEVLDRVEEFIEKLADGELEAAFTICPVFDPQQGLVEADDTSFFESFLHHAVYQFLEAYAEEDDAMDEDDPISWLAIITPLSEITDEDWNIEMPEEDEESEVVVDLAIQGELSDISARFDLIEMDGDWLLCFGNLDVL